MKGGLVILFFICLQGCTSGPACDAEQTKEKVIEKVKSGLLYTLRMDYHNVPVLGNRIDSIFIAKWEKEKTYLDDLKKSCGITGSDFSSADTSQLNTYSRKLVAYEFWKEKDRKNIIDSIINDLSIDVRIDSIQTDNIPHADNVCFCSVRAWTSVKDSTETIYYSVDMDGKGVLMINTASEPWWR